MCITETGVGDVRMKGWECPDREEPRCCITRKTLGGERGRKELAIQRPECSDPVACTIREGPRLRTAFTDPSSTSPPSPLRDCLAAHPSGPANACRRRRRRRPARDSALHAHILPLNTCRPRQTPTTTIKDSAWHLGLARPSPTATGTPGGGVSGQGGKSCGLALQSVFPHSLWMVYCTRVVVPFTPL
ncbi:hypothetical protein E2C01_031463 [Portunus trituberculatus]|uniref:Uncharacterized protein n=1 Tax=Portunus trituberculatus TaxID=210409 RepID=A0A5B7EXP2_PORTR|nr:hypothetical protein [Portunus trituberculatus]